MNNLGKIITKYRKENNLTQLDLSKKLNITDKAISRWETGKSSPDLDMIARLSKLFKVDYNDLLKARLADDKDGEIIANEITEEFKEIKKRNAKKIKISIIIFLIIILIYTIAIIFTHTFNRFKVYNVGIDTNNIYIVNGIYVETRIRDTLNIGDLKIKGYEINNSDIISVDLYYVANEKEYILQSYSSLENIRFDSNLSYIKVDDLSKYFDNLYLNISIINTKNKETNYTVKLNFDLYFSNNKIFYKNQRKINVKSINLNTDEIKMILLENGFEEVNNNNLLKEIKKYNINYNSFANKINYTYKKNNLNYRYTYNLLNNILEAIVYDENNLEIENYEYDAINNKIINCKTGSCNDYDEAMEILNQNVLYLFYK